MYLYNFFVKFWDDELAKYKVARVICRRVRQLILLLTGLDHIIVLSALAMHCVGNPVGALYIGRRVGWVRINAFNTLTTGSHAALGRLGVRAAEGRVDSSVGWRNSFFCVIFEGFGYIRTPSFSTKKPTYYSPTPWPTSINTKRNAFLMPTMLLGAKKAESKGFGA